LVKHRRGFTFISKHETPELIEVFVRLNTDWPSDFEPRKYSLALSHKLDRALYGLSCLLILDGDEMCDRHVLDDRVHVQHAAEAWADDRLIFYDVKLRTMAT
jgi:hypothetical protein